MLPIIPFRHDTDLRPLVDAMRRASEYVPDTKPGQDYSSTPQEAIRKAAPRREQILDQGSTRFIQVSDSVFVVVVLSIDVPADGPPCWHMSTSTAPMLPGHEPGRVSDRMCRYLSAAFETPTEGPPEGAFKNVRHFRGPYQPA